MAGMVIWVCWKGRMGTKREEKWINEEEGERERLVRRVDGEGKERGGGMLRCGRKEEEEQERW